MDKPPSKMYRMPTADIDFLDKLIDGYYAIDREWRYVYVNKAGATLARLTPKQMIGKKVSELFPDTFNLPFGRESKRVMKNRMPRRVEAYYPTMGKWYENHIYPTKYGISIFARDITEQKTLNNNLQFLADASMILSTSLDYHTTLRAVAKIAVPHIADWCSVDMLDEHNVLQLVAIAHRNPRKLRWAREYRKQDPVDMSAPTGAPQVLRSGKAEFYPLITPQLIKDSLKDARKYEKAMRVIRELGGLRSIIIVPICLQNKVVGVLQFVNTDTQRSFTETDLKMAGEVASRASLAIENASLYKSAQEELLYRKRLETALVSTQRRYDALVEANIIGVMIVNINGPIRQANDALLTMIGYTRRDLEQGLLNWTTMTPKTHNVSDQAALRDLKETGKANPYEKEYIRKDGSRVPVIVGVVMIDNNVGECIAFVLDITERKMLEERKDEFISIASHELKTPLTSIKGYVQILERIISEMGDERANRYLSKTNIYIDRLNSLIVDLLDVSKIQAGRLEFNISEFDCEEAVRDGIDSVQYAGMSHTIIKNGVANCKIRGDRHRVEQVFTNLLNNAIKYSPHADKVRIQLSIEGDFLKVAIRDYGMGIPANKHQAIFERFYRVEETSHEISGLGIGLYISSQIVARHGGTMWVKSKEGKGSTFYFTLPISK